MQYLHSTKTQRDTDNNRYNHRKQSYRNIVVWQMISASFFDAIMAITEQFTP